VDLIPKTWIYLLRTRGYLFGRSLRHNVGIGKPEPLKYDLSGWWSRQIDDTNRLIYRIEDSKIIVSHCRTHYGSK